MKRFISLLVIITMLVLPTLSGYAAPSFHDYIPEIPKFFTISSGKITFNVSIDNEPNAKKFYDSFYTDGKPYFILLEQYSYFPSKEDTKEPYYKNFVVTFVKPKITNPQSSLGAFLYEGATNGDNGSNSSSAPYYISSQNNTTILLNKCFHFHHMFNDTSAISLTVGEEKYAEPYAVSPEQ